VAAKLGISPAKQDEVAHILQHLYELFLNKDASMVEINPFAEVGRCLKRNILAKKFEIIPLNDRLGFN
jgi:succinyl-CoA synthetase beta subunit